MQRNATAVAGSAGGFRSGLTTRAWAMVAMATLGTMCCSTSVILVNVGIFMKPLAEAFGWSRGSITLSLSVGALSMALANPFVGRLIDRYGVRAVLITSLAGYCLAAGSIPTLVSIWGVWGLYLGYALTAMIGAGSNVIAYLRILSGWFTGPLNDSRGLALGIQSAGIPLGAALTGPIGVLLIDRFGWQGGYWGLVLLPLVVGLPIAIFAIRMAPSDVSTTRDGEPASPMTTVAGLDIGQAMRTRAFWLLMAIVVLMSSSLIGVGIHVAPFLSDHGISTNQLALILGTYGFLCVVGRLVAGYMFDRFFAPYVSLAIFGTAAAASFVLAGVPGLLIAIVGTVLITLASGAESDLIGYLVGRYFGLKAFGQIFGFIYGMFMFGVALGPYLFGVAFDYWGDYRIPFLMAGIGLSVLCGLLMLLPPFPDKTTFERAEG